jgi:tRNA pseudouridine-54 N-methylase
MKFFFLIPSSTIRTSTLKKVKSVVGGQERADVFSRILLNLYRWKDRCDAKSVVVLYLSHPEENLTFTIPLDLISSPIENELEATKFMINLLNSPDELGITLEKQDFSSLLRNLAADCNLFYLTSTGRDISKLDEDSIKSNNFCFILGSQVDLTDAQEKDLSKYDPTLISVGDREYLASHVVSIINHYLFTKFQ